jgi:hypothetical protein
VLTAFTAVSIEYRRSRSVTYHLEQVMTGVLSTLANHPYAPRPASLTCATTARWWASTTDCAFADADSKLL